MEVKAGDTFAFEWFFRERGDFSSGGDHVGPGKFVLPGILSKELTDTLVLVYMAPDVATGVNTPEIWTKLFHYGYNATDNTWADHYFKADATTTKGHHFITVPDVPAGDYLVRGMRHPFRPSSRFLILIRFGNIAEIITLQTATTTAGPQYYPRCVQVRVTSPKPGQYFRIFWLILSQERNCGLKRSFAGDNIFWLAYNLL